MGVIRILLLLAFVGGVSCGIGLALAYIDYRYGAILHYIRANEACEKAMVADGRTWWR